MITKIKFSIVILLIGANIMSSECIKILQIDRGTDPWHGMSRTYEEEEANKNIKALNLNKKEFTFFTNLDKYRISNMNLLGKNIKNKFITVEKTFFSDLKKADATRLKVGEKQVIGRINLNVLKSIDYRTLSCFLIESHIITTFWHIESNLCMIKEENLDASYKAVFTGEHIYFTNKKHKAALNFSVLIDKKTGEMSIIQGN